MTLPRGMLWRYASLGIPLGFLGLPLYMHLPHYYAGAFGLSLSLLGAIFMLGRLVDCLADPWLGRLLDGPRGRRWMLPAAIVCAAGMLALFTLPLWQPQAPSLPLITACLIATYLGYSVLSIRFYAMAVPLASGPAEAACLSSWREAALIVGIILAAAAPGMGMPYPALAVSFALLLAAALWVGRAIGRQSVRAAAAPAAFLALLRQHGHLYLIFFFNALAPAITASLYLFYMDEVLQAPAQSALCLLAYFAAAMLAMPLWVKQAAKWGKLRCLAVAMLLAIASFVGAAQLGQGDVAAFLLICLLTGAAFGADAALLPSLLSDALSRTKADEHAAFGIWMAISKFTLALAAGLALPAVELLQHSDMARPEAIRITYGLLPCAIKAIALLCLLSYHRTQSRSSI